VYDTTEATRSAAPSIGAINCSGPVFGSAAAEDDELELPVDDELALDVLDESVFLELSFD
jgi:hypothetical protein